MILNRHSNSPINELVVSTPGYIHFHGVTLPVALDAITPDTLAETERPH